MKSVVARLNIIYVLIANAKIQETWSTEVVVNKCSFETKHFLISHCFLSADIAKCGFLVSKGDGFCDDNNNIPECDWDGGDCCGLYVQYGRCTECQCLDDVEQQFEVTG
jgi:hypothetical protein